MILYASTVSPGEVCLLPLDVLKIKAQTNPAVLKGKGLIELIVKENVKLYQGASWTVARNVPGSLCLFGGSAFIKENVFNPIHHSSTSRPYVMREYSLFETFVASAFGAFLAIVVSSPMDVVKTRLQNKDFGTTVRGSTVVAEIFRDEGIAAFSRGITPKLVTIGPKLVFSFTIAQYITAEMQKTLKH